MAALLFLYRHVLEEPLPWLDDLVRAQRPERLPVVLTFEEVRDVMVHLELPAKLVVQLLYGSGLRLLEALALRIKDVDFARGQLSVRDPKWKHDRTTMLPATVTADLHEQIVHARLVHQEDLPTDAIVHRVPSAPGDPRWHRGVPGISALVRQGRPRGPAPPARDCRAARRE